MDESAPYQITEKAKREKSESCSLSYTRVPSTKCELHLVINFTICFHSGGDEVLNN